MEPGADQQLPASPYAVALLAKVPGADHADSVHSKSQGLFPQKDGRRRNWHATHPPAKQANDYREGSMLTPTFYYSATAAVMVVLGLVVLHRDHRTRSATGAAKPIHRFYVSNLPWGACFGKFPVLCPAGIVCSTNLGLLWDSLARTAPFSSLGRLRHGHVRDCAQIGDPRVLYGPPGS